ncbi:ABC transporter substrate-binding protein [Actinospica sp.]|uniref:ABC transporter substrate-binding protein n=1 Tax=Actinospica sp. TaxID=1872142 RepID=UPI002C1D20B2|nr:extracellular solute-binding protein [Actinospica sp.]HWG25591.1 extracellular solute-binding protein [Actinospica sp.]
MSSPHPRTPTSAAGRSRRSVLRQAASLALLGPALTALGGTSAAAATASAGASLDFEGVTLKVLCNTPHLTMYTNFLAPAWQQLTGGTLQTTAVNYTQLAGTIIQDVQSGTGEFDCFDYYYYLLGEIAHAGALVDLTSWIATQRDLDTSDFLQSRYDPYTLYRHQRYGLPYDGDQHLVFYNQELLGTYGLKPPTTWDEYDAAAKTITEGGGGAYYGAVVTGEPDPIVLGPPFINRLVGYGGDLVDRSGRPTLTTDAALAAAQHLIDIAPYAVPTPTSTGLGTATTSFMAGQAALVETWADEAHRFADPTQSKIVGKFGATALPLGGGNTRRRTPLDGGYGLGVSAASKNRDAALAFIKWATGTDEMLLETTQKNSAIDPNRGSVLNSSAYSAYVASAPVPFDLIRAGLVGTPMVWPNGPADPANLQGLVNQLALAIEGKQSAGTALQNAQQAWTS